MPDEATQAPEQVQDTPPPDAPEEGNVEAPQEPNPVNWEQRYNDLRPEFDRTNQLVAAARGDHGVEAQMEALQQLGVEVAQEEDEEDEELFEDPYEALKGEVETVKEQLASKAEAEEAARFHELEREYIETTLGGLEDAENYKLSAEDKRFVTNDAKANRLEDGRPDLEGAFALFKQRDEARQQAYLESKKAPKAPVGAAGEEQIDFSKMTKEQKDEWMAEDIQARMDAGES